MKTIYEASDFDLEHLDPVDHVLDTVNYVNVMLTLLSMASRPKDESVEATKLWMEKLRRDLLASTRSQLEQQGWKLERKTIPVPEGLIEPVPVS